MPALPEQNLVSQQYTRAVQVPWLVARYGDSFEQRAVDGTNWSIEQVSLVWEGVTNTEASNIESVLNSSISSSIQWQGKNWYVNDYSFTERSGELQTVTATLSEKVET